MSSFPVDWMTFAILVGVLMNVIFVIAALTYTFLRRPDEVQDPRASLPGSIWSGQERRHSSLSPQVVIYHNLERLSISLSEGSHDHGIWQVFKNNHKQAQVQS